MATISPVNRDLSQIFSESRSLKKKKNKQTDVDNGARMGPENITPFTNRSLYTIFLVGQAHIVNS